jgi:hypothetical protein
MFKLLEHSKMSECATKLIRMHFSEVYGKNFYTHVTMQIPRRKWVVKNIHEYKKFLSKYEQYINRDSFNCSMAEIKQDYSMLVVDIDYKKDSVTLCPLHTKQDIIDMVLLYQKILDKDIDSTAVILTKEPYFKKSGVVSHGYHIQFPAIFLNRKNRSIIQKRVQSLTKIPIDDVVTKPWLLYGSQKSIQCGKYIASYIIDPTGKEITIKKFLTNYKSINMSTEKPEESEERKMARILLISPLRRNVIDTKFLDVNFCKPDLLPKPKPKPKHIYPVLSKPEELKFCKDLLKSLSSERYEDYGSWFSIGDALHCTLNGSLEGLKLWKDWSSQSKKYNEKECESDWSRMRNDYTKGTLIYYFKKDNRYVHGKRGVVRGKLKKM